jgi:hypothetical protein
LYDDQPLEAGLAIVKDFCNRWNGCLTEDSDCRSALTELVIGVNR